MRHFVTMMLCLTLLVGAHAPQTHAQAGGSFDLQAYTNFLASHRDLTHEQLRGLHPTPNFRSKLDLTLTEIAYLDTIVQLYQLTSDEQALLHENGFVVSERLRRDSFGHAFLEIYKHDLPVFVSTDAILHALHRSYDAILQDTETGVLIPRLQELLLKLRNEWPNLATRYLNLPTMQPMLNDVDVYLTVALRLLGNQLAPHRSENAATVSSLLNLIAAEQPAYFSLFSETQRLIDFSQFRLRGHYTNQADLRNYFKAMIWLGRTELMLSPPKVQDGSEPSATDIQRQTIAAYLLWEAVNNSGSLPLWQEMDGIIRFLVGESDNITVDHLQLLANEISLADASELLDSSRLQALQSALAEKSYALQRINSQILISDPNNPEQIAPPSAFLLLGQRFVIDSYVMGNVVYDRILYQDRKVLRMLPSSLDVLFALGNDAASILLQDELQRYPYASNLSALRYLVDSYEDEFWKSALYNVWLQAIRSLNPAGDLTVFPAFMQTGAFWQQKMNTQLASWAQLRHDNLLYAKQSYTSGTTCLFPYSFVEPFPEFYRTLQSYAEQAEAKFNAVAFGEEWLKASITRYFSHMAGVMDTLAVIAGKQLHHEEPDSAEIRFLRRMMYSTPICGEQLDGWYAYLYYRGAEQSIEKDLVVADVHTQPTDESGALIGKVMHAGTGPLDLGVFIAENYEGKATAFIGPVMSYYEHVTMNFQRLTDDEWQQLYQQPPSFRPAWVNVYLADAEGKRRGAGPQIVTSVKEPQLASDLPKSLLLHQNYPNPFNANTLIRFEISPAFAHAPAKLAIYNLRGELVRELIDQTLPAGNYLVRWDGKNDSGNDTASSVYFCRLQVGDVSEMRKLTLLR